MGKPRQQGEGQLEQAEQYLRHQTQKKEPSATQQPPQEKKELTGRNVHLGKGCSEFDVTPARKYLGGDLYAGEKLFTPNHEICCERCLLDDRCFGFTFIVH